MKLFLILSACAVLTPLAWLAARNTAVASVPVVAEASTWEIDAVHSSVVFKVLHMGVSNFYGRFNKISGSVVLNDAQPGESKVKLTIPADSIDTNSSGRDGHLKSPDFFNAAEYPEISFESKSVKKVGENRYQIDGDFSMHGVTKPLSVEALRVGNGESRGTKITGFDVNFTLKRSDFGMKFMLEGLGDEVSVMAGLECKAK
jgi:polyisoprenoid-binding protein YceI